MYFRKCDRIVSTNVISMSDEKQYIAKTKMVPTI